MVAVLTSAWDTEAVSSTSQVLSNTTVAFPVRYSKCLFSNRFPCHLSACVRFLCSQNLMCSPNSRVIEMWFIHGLFTNLWISVSFNIEEICTEVKRRWNGCRCQLFLRMTCSFLRLSKDCPPHSGLHLSKTRFLPCSCLWYLLLADHV